MSSRKFTRFGEADFRRMTSPGTPTHVNAGRSAVLGITPAPQATPTSHRSARAMTLRPCAQCKANGANYCTFEVYCAKYNHKFDPLPDQTPTKPKAKAKSPTKSRARSPQRPKMPAFKEDQVMMISPGSQTTLAQLGLPESYTPAALRIPSRMFPGATKGEWEPFKVRVKDKNASNPVTATDDATNGDNSEPEFYEDYDSDEGAVYPIINGRIVNWSCFFALISHVYNKLSPQMHIQTPVLFVAQPSWSERDHEKITQFFFEKFRTPGLVILDAAVAVQFGCCVENACVIDVGYSKVDITAFQEFMPLKTSRIVGLPTCSGNNMTNNLYGRLKQKGVDKDMCEQLKKSSICEVLPHGVPLPSKGAGQSSISINPAAAASTGATGAGPSHQASNVARGPGPNTEVGEESTANGEDEGILDVASLVTANPDKMQEMLKKKEQEKAEKASRKKDGRTKDPPKEIKLLNSQKEKASFTYIDRSIKPAANKSLATAEKPAEAAAEVDGADGPAVSETAPAAQSSEGQTNGQNGAAAEQPQMISNKREVEIGVERFGAASEALIDSLADAVYRVIARAGIEKRSEIWNNLILVGNGSKVRGFREALMASLQRRYIISPSSATIFTSEIPSNISTPMGTGAQTPVPQPLQNPFPGQMPLPSGVNPLLLAATTASNPMLQHQASGGLGQMLPQGTLHSSHGQVPTSIKWTKDLDYFPMFKEHGMEEAGFLGTQVAAKTFFISPAGGEKTYLGRAEYNELGPGGIHLITI